MSDLMAEEPVRSYRVSADSLIPDGNREDRPLFAPGTQFRPKFCSLSRKLPENSLLIRTGTCICRTTRGTLGMCSRTTA